MYAGAGIAIGVHLNGDEVDFVYEEGALLVAARMSRTGENGRHAADAVLATARAQAVPGVCPVLDRWSALVV